MKITAIKYSRHTTKFEPAFLPSWDTRPRTSFTVDLVRVETDQGVAGIGAGYGVAGIAEFADLFVGRDPRDLERHFRIIDNISFHYGRFYPLDCALWDLYGKLTGGPVWRLLGGGFSFEMLDGGRSLPHRGRYEVIERPRRLVFTWNSHATEGDSRVELTFEPRGAETLLTLRHERLPDALRVGQHTGGWSAILGKLVDRLGSSRPSDDFALSFDYATSPAAVYRALTTQAGIAGWWTRDCDVEPRRGGRVEARFPDHDFSAAMTVSLLEPDRLVEWTCIACRHPAAAGYADRGDWIGTRIRFTLEPAAGGTRLRFVHEGLRRLQCLASCEAGWRHFLGDSLRELMATGQGRPAERAR